MAVFKYQAKVPNREEHIEAGTVRAKDEDDARMKLENLHLDIIKIKKLSGMQAFIKSFTADVS